MTAHSDCSHATDRSIQTPDLPALPRQEARRQHGLGVETVFKTSLCELKDVTVHQHSPKQGLTQAQKRKRTSATHQAHKCHKTDDLGTSTLTSSSSQSDAQEQDTRLNSAPGVNSPQTRTANDITSNPIQYWAQNQQWPENFANMSPGPGSSLKRASSLSYTQRYKDGEVPEAYSAAYENNLPKYGIVMKESAGRSRISQQSRLFCDELLRGNHQEPPHTIFLSSQFSSVRERAQTLNEARIFRDITPLLVPSPALLSLSGHAKLEDLAEDISVEWTKCKPIWGPMPKPDFAVGLALSAFSEEELIKLENHASPEQPTAFTSNLYFPFVLCEAVCADQGIKKADRQNMHSGSIAVRAIVRLDETRGPERMNALDGETLVYSISHDHDQVKLYGHFVHKGIFYRYYITSFLMNVDQDRGWKKAHDFVRELYRLVYPAHLQRIRGALAAMADPREVSMTSSMVSSEGVEQDELQAMEVSVRSSQEQANFLKPSAPVRKKRKSEVVLLREQLAEQQKENKEQMAKQADHYKEQMAEQERRNREQMVEQERRSGEQMAEQDRRNREQMAEQERRNKEHMAEHVDQYKEQIKLLRQLLQRQ